MSLIKIYDAAMTTELATINSLFTCERTEKINSDNTLDFSLALDDTTTALINPTNTVKLGDDWFDIASYTKKQNGSTQQIVSVECEHVSYRLNDAAYNVEYFTEIGTPTYILGKILDGTDFTVGTVDFTGTITFSLQAEASRRGLLMQFVAYLEGEVLFDGFTVSIVTQRGSTTPKDLTANKNITLLSNKLDKRTLDSEGNPTVAYECALIEPVEALALGDVVTLEYDLLDIDVSLRIVSLTTNPYDATEVSFSVGNYVNELEDDLYRIETETVKKDALLNGVRIGPEYGFEAVRNDKKARAYFKSDGMKFQSGDGSGTTWKDRLYYDYDSETGDATLVFDGKLSADAISAIVVDTPNLYAGKANISELTVDKLDTSDKVQNYLNSVTDDDNFQRIYDQFHDWITATTDGLEENKVQATNREGALLYWTDETHTAADTTEREGLEVWTFLYTETNKMRIGFRLDPGGSGYYIPTVELGAGTGSGDSGKGFMYKGTSGLYLDYYSSIDGSLRRIILGDDGIVLTPYGLNSIDFYDNGFSAVYDGETVSYNWTLNPDGTIATLVTEDLTTIPITWHSGDM